MLRRLCPRRPRGADFEADIQGRGTTNVDFNSAMRGALAQIRHSDTVRLGVGATGVQLTRAPTRPSSRRRSSCPCGWIKGFTEVQAYLPALKRRFTIPAAEAVRFVRGLPRGGNPKQARG